MLSIQYITILILILQYQRVSCFHLNPTGRNLRHRQLLSKEVDLETDLSATSLNYQQMMKLLDVYKSQHSAEVLMNESKEQFCQRKFVTNTQFGVECTGKNLANSV